MVFSPNILFFFPYHGGQFPCVSERVSPERRMPGDSGPSEFCVLEGSQFFSHFPSTASWPSTMEGHYVIIGEFLLLFFQRGVFLLAFSLVFVLISGQGSAPLRNVGLTRSHQALAEMFDPDRILFNLTFRLFFF